MNQSYYCQFQQYLDKSIHLKLPYQAFIQTKQYNTIYSDDYQYLGTIYPINIFQNATYDDLPKSIDFREFLSTPAKNQYSCGACATFVCIENVETTILSTFESYYLNKAFANDTSSMRVSPTFILDNSINSAKCQGSNYFILMNDIAYMRTMETENNFPYRNGMTDDDFRVSLTKLDNQQFITPFRYAAVVQDDTITSNTNMLIIKNHNSVQTVPFTQEEVNKIKWILARGIAVQGSMLTSVNIKDQAKFSGYKQGIIDGACDSASIDHAIEFVGYGRYGGKEVFVIRNSWGKEFGMDGTFYVEIGKNSYCIENEANANIPEQYTKYDFGTSKPLDFSDINQYVFMKQYNIQRGQDGLDYDDGSYDGKMLALSQIFEIFLPCMVVYGVLLFIIQCTLTKRSAKRRQQSEQNEQSIQDNEQPQK